jgi:nitroreductase
MNTVGIPARTVPLSAGAIWNALHQAATVAGYAPSIHNTQPWRWHVGTGVLDLWADRSRQLVVADPAGRMLTISCGAALHHALVTLAVQGLGTVVLPFPDPHRPDLLARVTVTGNVPITTASIRALDAIALRRTDRRPVTDEPMDDTTMRAIAGAAPPQGALLRFLGPTAVPLLAGSAAAAAAAQQADPAYRAELDRWAGAEVPDTGVPDDNIPSRAVRTPVPERDFGRPGTLPVRGPAAGAAAYAVLYGEQDDPAAWLAAGRALSAVWLMANELDVSVVPVSAVTEVPTTRRRLRELLAPTGWPYLVLRMGLTDPRGRGPLVTPRLPADQTVH